MITAACDNVESRDVDAETEPIIFAVRCGGVEECKLTFKLHLWSIKDGNYTFANDVHVKHPCKIPRR